MSDLNLSIKDALKNNTINITNKINNIAIHCHGIDTNLINMNDYSIFSSLEPGKYILVMDEKTKQFDKG